MARNRHAFLVAAGIFLSRVVGLVRQRVFSHYFGIGLEAGAWGAAFRIPNFMRRLFAEGSFSTAFVPVFTDLTETERSTISNRSIKLFTLSGIYHATQTLVAGLGEDLASSNLQLAADFWNEVARHVPDWKLAQERKEP